MGRVAVVDLLQLPALGSWWQHLDLELYTLHNEAGQHCCYQHSIT